MLFFLIAAVLETVGEPVDVVSAWTQFTEAIVDYRVVGAAGLVALFIAALVAVLKRIGAGGPGPNWWGRMPRWGKRLLIAGLGVLAGVFSAIQAGVHPGQAIVLGFSGLLSIAGHELARRLGVIASPSKDEASADDDAPVPPKE